MQRHDLRADTAERRFSPSRFPQSRGVDIRTPSGPVTVIGLVADDLPCPWCGQSTAESDPSCGGCGRRFG